MDTYCEYSGCDLEDERQIEACWERILPELEANLESLSVPATELRMAIDHEDESPEWRINAALHFPGRTIAVEARANDIPQAMDDLLVGLASEVDQVQDTTVQISKRLEGLDAVVEFLEQCHVRERRATFMSFLTPIVSSLASYAHRELQIREIEGALPSTELSTMDILDESLVRAWSEFGTRPRKLSLDAWILRLMDRILDAECKHRPLESLDDELPLPSTEPLSQRDYWQEQTTYPETIEVHELMAGPREASAWDDTDAEVKQEKSANLLAGLPRQQRQALLLCSVHGFSETEIADFQDRSLADVKHDIESANEHLARRLSDDP